MSLLGLCQLQRAALEGAAHEFQGHLYRDIVHSIVSSQAESQAVAVFDFCHYLYMLSHSVDSLHDEGALGQWNGVYKSNIRAAGAVLLLADSLVDQDPQDSNHGWRGRFKRQGKEDKKWRMKGGKKESLLGKLILTKTR